MNIVVFGGGMIGRAIALDLVQDKGCRVTVADVSKRTLDFFRNRRNIGTLKADLTSPPEIQKAIEGHELVIGALPGEIGFNCIKSCLEAGKHVVDICFSPEDPFLLDQLAKEKGVICLVDFGLAPGCSNLLLGHLMATMNQLYHFECHVGGLPLKRQEPWEYKAPFSPSDVLQEYIRPARFVEKGEVVTLPALSRPEIVHFPEVGPLESFLTDGLRTMLRVRHQVPSMVEKTCRYPGYRERILLLRDSGFLNQNPVQIKSGTIRPIDLTLQLLSSIWKLEPGEEDLTVMRVTGQGLDKKGREVNRTWVLFDCYDKESGTSSMARTTGYTCSAALRLITSRRFTTPGVSPPETVGQDPECFNFIMRELKKRNIDVKESTEVVSFQK